MSTSEIVTLNPEELSGFLTRSRKADPLAQFEHRLADDLREILRRCSDFIPSTGGAILLDDPRVKLGMQGRSSGGKLTVIATFGDAGPFALGTRQDSEHGFAGQIYGMVKSSLSEDLLGAPIVVGASVCGVLVLRSPIGGAAYHEPQLHLLQLFGDHVASTLQNALDSHRAREVLRRDSLTGLYNDRFLHPRLEEELMRAERDSTPLSLLFIDLDDFKRVNDRFGHLAGSRTLREVGQVLRGAIPPGSIPVRYGGDEFVVLLAGADAKDARAVAEDVRHAVESTAMPLQGTPTMAAELGDLRAGRVSQPALDVEVFITCSIGVASYHEHVNPIGSIERRQNSLLHLADGALYAAKTNGKNQVRVASAES